MKRSDKATTLVALIAAIAGGVVWWKSRPPSSSSPAACTPEAFRAAAVAAAQSQLGKAELDRYYASAAPQYLGNAERPEWCGIFDLWALHEANLGREVQWKTGLGFAYRLPRTRDPKPGDIAYFHTPYQHHAMVAAVRTVDGARVVDLLNGNGQGGVVSASTAPIEKATDYYSIQPWVDSAVRECSK